MRARDVTSPIHRTRNHVVKFESPYNWNEEWSIVEAEVLNEDGETWERSLGIRWDGDRRDSDSKGFPNSSGRAVWFWIPTELRPFFDGAIIPQLLDRRKREKSDRKIQEQLGVLLEKLEELTSESLEDA